MGTGHAVRPTPDAFAAPATRNLPVAPPAHMCCLGVNLRRRANVGTNVAVETGIYTCVYFL
jgi:hypothetical protein